MEERIIDLETRLIYQDDLLQKLDEVVANQQKEIEELKLQVRHISQQLQVVHQGAQQSDEPPPPHY
jgi:SlyX protein